jgi:hypothetical protein
MIPKEVVADRQDRTPFHIAISFGKRGGGSDSSRGVTPSRNRQ